jgi:hypothetical protein
MYHERICILCRMVNFQSVKGVDKSFSPFGCDAHLSKFSLEMQYSFANFRFEVVD